MCSRGVTHPVGPGVCSRGVNSLHWPWGSGRRPGARNSVPGCPESVPSPLLLCPLVSSWACRLPPRRAPDTCAEDAVVKQFA